MARHPLLRRQIAAHAGPPEGWPDWFERFLDAVDGAYELSDVERTLLERSLDLSSQELLQANSDMRAVIAALPDVFLWVSHDGTVLGCRAQESTDLLMPPRALVGKRLTDIPDADAAARFREALAQLADGATLVTVEYALDHQTDRQYYEARLVRLDQRQHLVIVRNVTERRRSDLALRERDDQLRQAQKMEAVGQLAGGIAHDFNNLLTAISGYTGLILEQLDAANPLRGDVEEVRKAGESAASLTQQLLAFSRRQILRPRVLDLNSVVGRVGAMLQRLIGEHIELVLRLAPSLHNVNVDQGQIEQIIVNLAVNGRDAMPMGGTLTIETANVEVDEALANKNPGLGVGPCAALTVRDTGIGISKENLERIFEPFFTTKPKGEGSGLGLATVYGIVNQSGGAIALDSQVGVGTTFTIYLPGIASKIVNDIAIPSPKLEGGSETILIAEDQREVRAVTQAVLERHGYKVLVADGGAQALEIVNQGTPVDLLLTDVVMPGMSGPELAIEVVKVRPQVKVLYASGYTGERLGHAELRSKRTFIAKPFTPAALLGKVREVLDAADFETPVVI